MKKYLLFDLDGTLTDPKVGICTCVQYALASFGIEAPDIDKLEPFIGPPLKDSFMQFYQMDSEQADAAIAKYRERYSEVGLFENTVYEGIPQMLRTLKAKGMLLAVASSKPTVFVERILQHFGIRDCFKAVVGSELDGSRVQKDEVVAEALRQLFGQKPVAKEQVYMIGDRRFDVEGARAMGIESIGVTYGYGSMEELKAAKADYIVQSVAELQKFLLREVEEPRSGLTLQRLFKTIYPLLLFWLVKTAAMVFVQVMFIQMGGSIFGTPMIVFENGNPAGATPAGSAVMSIFGFLAGAAAVWKGARIMIKRAGEESKLLHLRKDAPVTYGYLAAAAVGAMLGLNLFLQLTGLVKASEAYEKTAQSQYAVPVLAGILLYGIAAPVAEELLFRGIIYNGLKRSIRVRHAILFSAALFGVYHGNSVQALYGFLMGCLFAYGYEYFGSFKVPLGLHIGVNLCTYLLSLFMDSDAVWVNWPVCVIALMVSVLGLRAMRGRKKI